MNKILLSLLLVMILFSPASADSDKTVVRAEGKGTPDSPYKVTKVNNPIRIDGVVSDEEWEDALLFNLKYEVSPGENTKPPVDTEFFITYDEQFLYVAFRCYDPNPDEIRARYRDRDSIWSDDRVGIVIDTFNDQRRAYDLQVNPYGVQSDAIRDEASGGRGHDSQWNIIWDSAGSITDYGWAAEMAIPFSQIRIQQTDGPQIWGIDATRDYPRSVTHDIGLFPRERGNNSYLSQTRKIIGFAGLEKGENLEIVPTLTAGRVDERKDFPYGDLQEADSKIDAGVTTRWGVTPNITLLGTINPDFSQVEADDVKLDINQRFTLYYDETRPFFLEGKNYFNTREMNLLHTRNIVDPDVALKTTGKVGPHTFGVFSAEDKFTSIIVPGAEGSEAESFDFASTASVARYQYDFGKNSNIGTMVTNRSGNDYSNTVMNVDASIRFTDSVQLSANIAHSMSDYNQAMVAAFDLEEKEISGTAMAFDLDYSGRNIHLSGSYREFDDTFRADLGFITKVDYRQWGSRAQYRWYGSADRWFTSIRVSSSYEESETLDGQLLEREFETSLAYHGPLQTSLDAEVGARTQTYLGIEYDQSSYSFRYHGRPTSYLFINAYYNFSDSIDYTHNREAEQDRVGGYVSVNLGDHLIVEGSTGYRTLDVLGGELFNTFVQESTISYQFNRRARLRTILQYAQINRNTALYADDVAPEESDFFSQLLFSYKINPQTVLYLGYDDTFQGDNEIELTRIRRGYFVKLSYAWLQ